MKTVIKITKGALKNLLVLACIFGYSAFCTYFIVPLGVFAYIAMLIIGAMITTKVFLYFEKTSKEKAEKEKLSEVK